MHKKYISLVAAIFLIGCSSQSTEFTYPESKKIDFVETIHGYEIEDSYRWLEDFTSNESQNWVERQNKFTQKFIGKNRFKNSIAKDLVKASNAALLDEYSVLPSLDFCPQTELMFTILPKLRVFIFSTNPEIILNGATTFTCNIS